MIISHNLLNIEYIIIIMTFNLLLYNNIIFYVNRINNIVWIMHFRIRTFKGLKINV